MATDAKPGAGQVTAEEIERRLREELWGNHGCESIARYGDDGEMQCGQCGTDFKRWPIADVFAKVDAQRWKRLAEACKAYEESKVRS